MFFASPAAVSVPAAPPEQRAPPVVLGLDSGPSADADEISGGLCRSSCVREHTKVCFCGAEQSSSGMVSVPFSPDSEGSEPAGCKAAGLK